MANPVLAVQFFCTVLSLVPLHGSAVLIIDDEESLARVLRRNLASRGLDVETAGTGTDGLALWRRWRPDLIVLDLGLPDGDGVDLIHEIRATSSVPGGPAIFLNSRPRALNSMMGDDDMENSVSLSAMEAELKPKVALSNRVGCAKSSRP